MKRGGEFMEVLIQERAVRRSLGTLRKKPSLHLIIFFQMPNIVWVVTIRGVKGDTVPRVTKNNFSLAERLRAVTSTTTAL